MTIVEKTKEEVLISSLKEEMVGGKRGIRKAFIVLFTRLVPMSSDMEVGHTDHITKSNITLSH